MSAGAGGDSLNCGVPFRLIAPAFKPGIMAPGSIPGGFSPSGLGKGLKPCLSSDSSHHPRPEGRVNRGVGITARDLPGFQNPGGLERAAHPEKACRRRFRSVSKGFLNNATNDTTTVTIVNHNSVFWSLILVCDKFRLT